MALTLAMLVAAITAAILAGVLAIPHLHSTFAAPQRLANYRDGIARVTALIARRADLVAALPPVRERFEQAIAEVPDRGTARSLFRAQNQVAAALLAHDPIGAEQSAQGMRALPIDDPSLRSAANAYADAISSISETEGEIAKLDKEVLGTEGRLIGRATELLRELIHI